MYDFCLSLVCKSTTEQKACGQLAAIGLLNETIPPINNYTHTMPQQHDTWLCLKMTKRHTERWGKFHLAERTATHEALLQETLESVVHPSMLSATIAGLRRSYVSGRWPVLTAKPLAWLLAGVVVALSTGS